MLIVMGFGEKEPQMNADERRLNAFDFSKLHRQSKLSHEVNMVLKVC